MRILIVAPLYPPDTGRLATYIKELATHLVERHRVSVVVYGSSPEAVEGVRMVCTGKHWPVFLRTILFSWRLWREARGAELLYVSDGASVGLPSILVGQLRGIPVCRFVREDEARERIEKLTQTTIPEETFAFSPVPDLKIRLIRFLQTWVLRRAKRILVPSGWLKDIFARAYQIQASRMVVLPYPPERLQTIPFPLEPKPYQLLVTSLLTKTSGVQELLTVFSVLREKRHLLTLVIANDGPEEALLRTYVAENGLDPYVQFLGQTSQVERSYVLQTSGALILNVAAPEALQDLHAAYAARLPVVTMNTLDTLERLLPDQELRDQLIGEGLRSLHDHASWKHHLEQILTL